MNILIMPARYSMKAGLEAAVGQLVYQLVDRGHKVKIVADCPLMDRRRTEWVDNIEITHFHFFSMWLNSLWPIEGFFRTWFYFFYTPLKLAYIILRFQPHIVNIHYFSSQAIYAAAFSYLFGYKLVVSIYGFGLHGFFDSPTYIHRLAHWVLKRADCITFTSHALFNDTAARMPDISGKSIVIPNGISCKEFDVQKHIRYQDPFILTIGNFYFHKGYDLLFMAFSRIADRCGVDLVVVGEGPKKSDLEALMHALGLEERVHFFGVAERDEVVSLLHCSEFFVLPSRVEPFGIVLLEAMAAGKAVIASNTDGIPEIITDGANGLLVPPKDVKALASIIIKLLEDKVLRDKFGKNGRKTVIEKFTLEKQVDAFEKTYKRLLNE